MNTRYEIITLTTDFGVEDWFVGVIKGVILQIAPRARIIDLAHGIPAGDRRAGAFALAAAAPFFPPRSIHVAVVDPGVGSHRAAIALETNRGLFLGPDNGVLSWAVRALVVHRAHRLENPRFLLRSVSRTFHGRDVFAPAAAHLLQGVPIGRIGPKADHFERLAWPVVVSVGRRSVGEVLYVDRFGNAISNLPNSLLEARSGRWVIVRGGRALCPVGECYQAVPRGRLVAVPGSTGFLEIAVNGGNAAQALRLRPGSPLTLAVGEPSRPKPA
jgi:S-adenosylmethionine hydrolase